MKMSFRIGEVEHAANISFGLEKSKGFCVVFLLLLQEVVNRSFFLWMISLKPIKEKTNTVQTNTA